MPVGLGDEINKNIFKELFDDLRITSPQNGDLQNWAHQGVLMLNNSLTVEKGMPGSHQGKGWENFTDTVLSSLEDPKRKGSWDRRGMVVGSVQSGKTANFLGLIAKARDAGYKFIIIFIF